MPSALIWNWDPTGLRGISKRKTLRARWVTGDAVSAGAKCLLAEASLDTRLFRRHIVLIPVLPVTFVLNMCWLLEFDISVSFRGCLLYLKLFQTSCARK